MLQSSYKTDNSAKTNLIFMPKKKSKKSTADGALKLTMPKFFVVSPLKLVIMSVCTFGLYDIYWIYRQWQAVDATRTEKISPLWRTVFSIYYIFQLFTEMKVNNPISLGAAYLVVGFLSELPAPWLLIGFFNCVPLAIVQSQVNSRMNIAGMRDDYSMAAKATIAIGGILFLLVVYSSFLPGYR